MAFADPVEMFHPGVPGDETGPDGEPVVVERSTYRSVYYQRGWRSDDDPGFTGEVDVEHYDPGTELFSASKSDGIFSTASTDPVPVTGWSGSAVMPGQPVRIEAAVAAFSNEIGVTASARAGNVVTLTVAAGHGVVVGDAIQVKVADATYNGHFVVSAVGATSISYAQTAADDPDGGTGKLAGLLMPRSGGTLSLFVDLPVTAAARASNQVTLTVPFGHGIKVGADVVVNLSDDTFDLATPVGVNQVTDTTIRVPQTAADDPDGGTGTVSVRIGVRHEFRASDVLRPFARVPDPKWDPDPGLAFTVSPRLQSLSPAGGVTILTGAFFGSYHGVLTGTVA